MADVDAQLQAGAGDDRLQLARLQRRLDRPSTVGVERRVVGGDGLGADAQLVAEVVGDLLGEGPGVGEDDGGPGLEPVASRSLRKQAAIGQAAMRSPPPASGATRPRSTTRASPSGRGATTTRQVPRRPDQEPRHRLGGSTGRREADRGPDRSTPRAASRSSETARSAPRLFGTSAVDLVEDQVADPSPESHARPAG